MSDDESKFASVESGLAVAGEQRVKAEIRSAAYRGVDEVVRALPAGFQI